MMKELIKQEISKQIKQKNVLIHTVLIIISTTIVSLFIKYSDTEILIPEKILPALFGVSGLIVFCLVYFASQLVSMEFRYGTIKTILMQGYTRKQILTSKTFVILIYSLFLHAVAFIATMILKMILFPEFHFDGAITQGHSLFEMMILNTLGSFIASWLFISVVIMITCLVKKDAIASLIGVVAYFLTSMLAGIQFSLLKEYSWLKWNPFNMLNLNNQLTNFEMMRDLTQLTTSSLLIGNCVYVIIFLFLGYLTFNKKRI